MRTCRISAAAAVLLGCICSLSAQAPSGISGAATGEPPVQIRVDLQHGLGAYRPIYRWFGYDEANYSTTANGQALLRELHALTPAPVFIRVHHLLTSGDGTPSLKWSSTGVYREDAQGHAIYNWKILDGIFDAYKAAGVKPMVELGFMPQDLAASSPARPYHVPFPQGDVLSGASNNAPKDYRKWEALTRAVTAHLVERYGRDEVLGWYFEVWNEPDIEYWHGSEADYERLYDYAVAGVREALPEARVGGPAITSPRNNHARAFLKAFLDHVATGKSAANGGSVPLDFISFHAKGQPAIHDGQVTMGIDRELEDVDRGFALVASYPKLRRLPVILSEADPEGCAACSSKMHPANDYRNGTLYPAYTAAVYKRMFDLAGRYRINLIGMLSWSFEFEGRDYFEGFRSLSTNGIDKPSLNFFRMAGLLSGERVSASSTAETPLATMLARGVRDEPDVAALATAETRSAAVLLWNYRDTEQDAPAKSVDVRIAGLPPQKTRVLLEQFRIDATHSNAYTAWKAMGSPQNPTAEELAELRRAGQLQMLGSPQWVEAKNGVAELPLTMPGESLALLRLRW
ncbi:MAG TPA: beta-xylosidase [Acidobacteriaceae bacterium]|jgi:xylan 1,4-beta-xylosidase|nr:beta-xylosidase [Acidobacteriaceae bacterium]